MRPEEILLELSGKYARCSTYLDIGRFNTSHKNYSLNDASFRTFFNRPDKLVYLLSAQNGETVIMSNSGVTKAMWLGAGIVNFENILQGFCWVTKFLLAEVPTLLVADLKPASSISSHVFSLCDQCHNRTADYHLVSASWCTADRGIGRDPSTMHLCINADFSLNRVAVETSHADIPKLPRMISITECIYEQQAFDIEVPKEHFFFPV
jgi:hypothetical protein